jgi:flagellar protein FlbD
MILVTKLSGQEIVLNSDLIETIEATPDTVVTLVDGTRYLITEAPREVVARIQAYRVALLRLADDPLVDPARPPSGSRGQVGLVAVRNDQPQE